MPVFNKDNQVEEAHTLGFSREQRTFTDDSGRPVSYMKRSIIIDGIDFSVNSKDGKVFDIMFRDEIEDKNILNN